jgi:hypothetical protein
MRAEVRLAAEIARQLLAQVHVHLRIRSISRGAADALPGVNGPGATHAAGGGSEPEHSRMHNYSLQQPSSARCGE